MDTCRGFWPSGCSIEAQSLPESALGRHIRRFIPAVSDRLAAPPPASAQPLPSRTKLKGEDWDSSVDDDLELAPIDDENGGRDDDDIGLILDEPGEESDDGLIPLTTMSRSRWTDAAPSRPVVPPRPVPPQPVPPRVPPVRGAFGTTGNSRSNSRLSATSGRHPPQPAAIAETSMGLPLFWATDTRENPGEATAGKVWDTPLITSPAAVGYCSW